MIRNRDLFILLGIALFSSIVAFSIHNSTPIKTERANQRLLEDSPIHFDDVQTIAIQKDGNHYEFVRDHSVWWMIFPYTLRMDVSSMNAIGRTIQGSRILGVLSTDSNEEGIGLGERADSVLISDGKEEIKIYLGRKTLGGRAYAQVGNENPVIVDQSIHRRVIDMDYRLWRDVRLFPDFAIDGLRIERIVNQNRLILDRSSGRWEMNQPVPTRVSQDALVEWVGRLASLRANSFVIDVPEDLALFGLENPVASFLTTNQNGETNTLLIGGRVAAGSQDRYVMLEGRPVIDKVPWEELSELFLQAEYLIDATSSAVSRFDIKQLTIRIGKHEVTVQRKLDQWIHTDGIPVDATEVEALLTWLLDTSPQSVLIAPYPRESEIATVTLEGYDLLPLDTIRIALDSTTSGLILENGDNVLRLHSAESTSFLEPFKPTE